MLFKDLKSNKTYWTNKKVISIDNGHEVNPHISNLSVGIVKDVILVSKSDVPIPIVKFDDGEKLCFSTIFEYNDLVYNALLKLNNEERWKLITSFTYRF